MPRVFRQQYTRPIPPDAQRATMKVRKKGGEVEVAAVRFRGPDGKMLTAPVTTKGKHAGEHCRIVSPMWYGRVKGVAVPLCANKAAAEVMLADKVRNAERGEAEMIDPYREHRRRPLLDHLADFEAALAAGLVGKQKPGKKPPGTKHVTRTVTYVRRVIRGCGFRTTGDINAAAVQQFVHGLTQDAAAPAHALTKELYTATEASVLLRVRSDSVSRMARRAGMPGVGRGKSATFTRAVLEELIGRQRSAARKGVGLGDYAAGLHARDVKTFTRWLVKEGRLPKDPLAELAGAPTESDHRHDRRTLDENELRRLMDSAGGSTAAVHGIAGPDRRVLYLVAMSTGFRRKELAALTPARFELGGPTPLARLREADTKNGRAAEQPLPPDVAAELRAYLAGKPADRPVWPGLGSVRTSELVKHDLQAAGIPYVVQGLEGPLYADFHALRHSYVALLDRAGATLKQAMQLARHSDPKLTMARYGKATLQELAAPVTRLPGLAGVDVPPYPPLTQNGDLPCVTVKNGEGTRGEPTAASPCHKSLSGVGIDEGRGVMSHDEAERSARESNPVLLRTREVCRAV